MHLTAAAILLLSLAPQTAHAAGPEPFVGVPNLDDDDVDGRPDRDQACAARGDNDLRPLTFASPPALLSLHDGRAVRICHDGKPVLGVGASASTWRPPPNTERIWVEFTELNAAGDLRVDGGHVALRAAPILLPSALQPAWRVWLTVPGLADRADLAMAGQLHAVLGTRLSFVGDSPDQWVQDHVELASASGGGSDLSVALLHRDATPLRELLRGEPDLAELPGLRWHQFGDLEATPPVLPTHPAGLILTSADRRDPKRERLVAFFERQGAQPVLRLDTSWLSVGHVDEVVSFVPDRSAPHGFRALVPDPRAGLALIARAPPHHRIPRFDETPTAGRLASDRSLREFNEALADGPLQRIREALETGLGLAPEEVLGLPMLYRPDWDGDEALAAALIPNPVNLLLVDDDDGAPVAFLPDPWFRRASQPPTDDPFARAWLRALDPLVRVVLVDDWQSYHDLGGELHCATAAWRQPLQAVAPQLSPRTRPRPRPAPRVRPRPRRDRRRGRRGPQAPPRPPPARNRCTQSRGRGAGRQ